MSKKDGCKQGCCRVPYEGVCAQKWQCVCHAGNDAGIIPLRDYLGVQ